MSLTSRTCTLPEALVFPFPRTPLVSPQRWSVKIVLQFLTIHSSRVVRDIHLLGNWGSKFSEGEAGPSHDCFKGSQSHAGLNNEWLALWLCFKWRQLKLGCSSLTPSVDTSHVVSLRRDVAQDEAVPSGPDSFPMRGQLMMLLAAENGVCMWSLCT